MTKRTNRQPIGISPDEKDDERFITFENVADYITIDKENEEVHLWGGGVRKVFTYEEYNRFVSTVLEVEDSFHYKTIGENPNDFQDLHLELVGNTGQDGPGVKIQVWQNRSPDEQDELVLYSDTVVDAERVLMEEVSAEYTL